MAIEHKGSFIPEIEDGVILVMPQGGPITYRTEFEADRHAELYRNGWTGAAYPEKKENVI